VEIDVDTNPELQKMYGAEVPVVEIGPYKLRPPFGRSELEMTLNAERDRQRQIKELELPDNSGFSNSWTAADRFTYWFSNHYVAVLNFIVAIYLGLAILAPVLMKVGWTGPARIIYRGYSMVCHQLSYRSIFLFGEQYVYPREAARIAGLETFGQATGFGEASTVEDLLVARTFVGNDTVGYKIALCQRDVAIYAGILAFGLIFAVTARRLHSLPWYLWFIIGILPIAIDGFAQLFSQPPLEFIPFRESTPFLRLVTGFLFGYTTAWFGYPLVEQTMADTRQVMSRKLARYKKAQAESPQSISAD
jgi:uncharacterized membrane protein